MNKQEFLFYSINNLIKPNVQADTIREYCLFKNKDPVDTELFLSELQTKIPYMLPALANYSIRKLLEETNSIILMQHQQIIKIF